MSELGNLISTHEENTTATGSTLLIGLLCFGLTAGMIALFFGEEELSFNKILFGASGVFALLGGIGCALSVLKNTGIRVELYENGLIAEKGGKKHAANWDEIAVVTESVEKMYANGGYIYDRYLYTIEKRDGKTFELSNMVSDIAEIGRVIKQKTLERLYPQAAEQIKGGGQVLFDSLYVDKNGLSGIPWAQLSSVDVNEGIIEVKDVSGKTVVNGSYAATPNAHLLVALLTAYLSLD